MISRATEVLRRIGRVLAWPVRTRLRLLAHAWMLGLLIVGNASAAYAADGFIVGPDLGSTGGATLFERYDASAYTYPVDTDSDHDQLDGPIYELVNFVTNAVTWLALTLLRGALVCLQWMLELALYSEQASAIDATVADLAASIFFPLLGVSLVIAALSIYAKGRRDGGGVIGELAWLVAAGVFAVTFATQPSAVLSTVDDARASMSSAMMTGYARAAGTPESSVGYPTPDTGEDKAGAIRQLTDSLWNTYGVSGWCYTAWASVDSCMVVGQQYLEDPDAEDGPWGEARLALEDDGEVEPFGADTSWVRGQEGGRLGAALLLGFVAGFAAICLLALVVFGLMAAIGLIIAIFLGLIFLLTLIIPGRPRAIGVRWLEGLLGTFIQALMITTIIGAVMVTGAFFNNAVATYGIFVTAVFNVVTLLLGLRFRAQIENMVGFGTGATGTSVMSSFMAARMITMGARGGARMLGRVGGAATVGTGRVAAAATIPAAYAAGKAAHGARAGYRAARTRLAPLRPATSPAAAGQPGGIPGVPRPPAPSVTMPPPGGKKPPPPPPAPSIPVGGPPVARPARSPRPTGGTPPPPPPPSSTPRMAAPPRVARPQPSGSTPAPPPPPPGGSGAQPRMAPARAYRVPPVNR